MQLSLLKDGGGQERGREREEEREEERGTGEIKGKRREREGGGRKEKIGGGEKRNERERRKK